MEMLESAMAFAVAMIVFSTAVTGIVEILMRCVGMRERVLRKSVETLFDTVIWPRMKDHLIRFGDVEDERKQSERKRFVRSMLENPVTAGGFEGNGGLENFRARRPKYQIDALSPLAFAERLGRTEIGRAIVAEGEAQIKALVTDFVRTFDRFGRTAGEIFRKRAQFTAIAVGIVFAFAANIDAARLFSRLMENPNLRTNLIAEADDAAEANRKAIESLAKVEATIAAGGLDEDQIEVIREQSKALIARVNTARGEGLPIGPAFFPYCATAGAEEQTPLCKSANNRGLWEIANDQTKDFTRWVIMTILAGVLIGLGGPFWFRVFNGLSQVAQLLRAVGVGRKPDTEDKADRPAPEDSAKTAKPESVHEAFEGAAAVAHAAMAATGYSGPAWRPPPRRG